jgi:hypothetical protein
MFRIETYCSQTNSQIRLQDGEFSFRKNPVSWFPERKVSS